MRQRAFKSSESVSTPVVSTYYTRVQVCVGMCVYAASERAREREREEEKSGAYG